jgi:hypothetical protein
MDPPATNPTTPDPNPHKDPTVVGPVGLTTTFPPNPIPYKSTPPKTTTVDRLTMEDCLTIDRLSTTAHTTLAQAMTETPLTLHRSPTKDQTTMETTTDDHPPTDRMTTKDHTTAERTMMDNRPLYSAVTSTASSRSDTNPTVGTTVYGPPPTAGATILSHPDHQLKSPPEWMTTIRPGSGMALSTEPTAPRSNNSTAALEPFPLTTTANVTIHTRRDHTTLGNNAPKTIHGLVQEFRLRKDQDDQQVSGGNQDFQRSFGGGHDFQSVAGGHQDFHQDVQQVSGGDQDLHRSFKGGHDFQSVARGKQDFQQSNCRGPTHPLSPQA